MLVAQAGRLHSGLMLTQNSDDLLFREPRTLHRPYPFQGAGLYPFSKEVQVTGQTHAAMSFWKFNGSAES